MSPKSDRCRAYSSERGMSLVELMVAVAIGLVIVGVGFLSYLSASETGRQQTAIAQMNEEAQVGLAILSRELQLAGYALPTAVDASGTFTKLYSGRAIFGCDNGFSNPTVSPTSSLSCSATGGHSAFEVSYQADVVNTVPHNTGVPTDCLGNRLTSDARGPETATFYVAHNRFYINTGPGGRNELYCASQVADNTGGAQPLIDYVDSMKVWYGEASVVTADRGKVVRYVSAGEVKDGGTDWSNVVSVRICLLMRSAQRSSEWINSRYLDCDHNPQTSPDGHLRKAYFTTVALRNKAAY